MKTLLLIDAHALIYRFFHALPALTTPDNQPIGAVYGLANVILKILREHQPDYLAACFDRPEETFRRKEYAQYKATRQAPPDELISQFKISRELLDKFQIRVVEMPGFEADDLIGTLAEKFKKEPNLKIVIFSGDLDLLQLVENDKVVVEFLKTGISDTMTYDEKAVAARYDLRPEQLPDLKGLLGDVSDNIPGVKGVGPKTAGPLIKKYGTLENLFENLWQVSDKIGLKLTDKKEEALFSKKLATIKRDVPLFVQSLNDLKLEAIDRGGLVKYFENLGFISLIKRLNSTN